MKAKKQQRPVSFRTIVSSRSKNKWKAKTRAKNKVPLHKLLRASWKYQGKIFFTESTLHGVRYIAEKERPVIERLMWFICVMVGAIATMVIIVSLWEKFQTNPTITGLDTDFHNWDIAFPAVTLCPNKPWNESRLEAYVDKMAEEHSFNQTQTAKFQKFIMSLTVLTYSTISSIAENNEFNDILGNEDNLKKLTYELMDTCEDLLEKCEWKAEEYDCCKGFYPVYTESGFCYSFNSRHYEPLSPLGEANPEFEIQYIKETDLKWSLKFHLYERNSSDYNISIYLHNSDEIPGIEMKPQHIWDFKVDRILFSLKETYTTENAHQLTIKQRRCIFHDEVKLKIDNIYTYTACTQQCRMDNAQRLCQCVPHIYKTSDNENYKPCTLQGLDCISAKLVEISHVENCGCELGCSNTIYEVDKLGDLNSEITQIFWNFECEFTSWPMIKYKREVLFGWVDLLVSFGGIAGLFLGFSLLSGVEVIYYFTIRACCMVYKQRDDLTQMVVTSNKKEDIVNDETIVPYFIKEPARKNEKDMIRRRFKDNADFKVTPIMVKPINPSNKALPPFGIEYIN